MVNTYRKILIIKTGSSELLDSTSQSKQISLGEVFRTTCILHLYKNDSVSWLTSREAIPLLKNNPHISKLYITDEIDRLEKYYDLIINLEK